ncbi:MAG: hypothetical protein AAFR79_21140 [Pseudomonadota bacterium]
MKHAARGVLGESVLLRLGRRDVVPVDAALFQAMQERHADQLGAVVRGHRAWPSSPDGYGVGFTGQAGAGSRRP